MAAATMATNALALLFTVLFARLLGADGLRLAGRARLDVRDPGRARLGRAGRGGARDRARAARRSGAAGGGDARDLAKAPAARGRGGDRGRGAAARADRRPDLGVEEWAAAATAPTGVLWLLLSVERGALQGVHALQAGGVVDRARGVRPARVRPGAGAARARRDRRVPRHAAVAAGHRAGAVRGSARAARRARRRRRGAAAARSRRRRLARRRSGCSCSPCSRTST